MKIKTEEFKKFINKANLGGLMNSFIFKFEEDGIKIDVRNEANTTSVSGFLSKDIIENYEAIGKVAIKKVDVLKSTLNFFSNEYVNIEITKDKDDEFSQLVITSNKQKYKHLLSLIDSVEDFTKIKFEKIPFDDEVNVDSKLLKDTLKVVSSVDASSMKIKAFDKIFETIIGSDGIEFSNSMDLETSLKEKYNFTLPQHFFEIIKNVSDKIQMKIHTDDNVPVVITNNEENSKFIFAIAKRGE